MMASVTPMPRARSWFAKPMPLAKTVGKPLKPKRFVKLSSVAALATKNHGVVVSLLTAAPCLVSARSQQSSLSAVLPFCSQKP
jgi:hypothetical protein